MTATTPDTEKETVTITIDGKEIEANPGEMLITAAQRAGVFIPRFCYHDRLKPVGMCRMCLVEIEGVRGMPPACTTPVTDGMNVAFQKDNVDKVQEGVLEFLLINHPLDCPVCDRGGECPLQDQTLSCGPGESRFVEEKRHWEKPIEISDHVLLDRERCIQCSRCTRFADDVAGDPLITFVERGGKTEVNTFPNDPFASYFSGNIVQICPVGALTAKPYRFNARPWDLTGVETTCSGCAVGCKGEAQTSRNEMVRFLGVDSEPINQGWLCDKGRYGFDFINSEDRIRKPFARNEQKTRTDLPLNSAISSVAAAIKKAIDEHGPESIAVIGGAKGTNEDAYAIARLAKGVIGTSLVDAQVSNSLPADLILSSNRARIADIDNASAIISIGCDLKEVLPLVYLRVRKAVTEKGVSLIEASAYKGSTSAIANNRVDLVPGDEIHSKSAINAALDEALSKSASNNGKVIVIAGDINTAQDTGSYTELVSTLLERENTVLLPGVSTPNIIGAYEMGLAPGLLPGRVAVSSSQNIDTWPMKEINSQSDQNTNAILQQIKDGKIKVLITFGADIVASASDKQLAKDALANLETYIAVDAFENETTSYANIFIPSTLANERDGTVTNIEGRVQRVVQVVTPQGNVYDDWKIATLISEALGVEETYEDVSDITNEIAKVVPSFAHLTTGVLARSRDGAVVPVDENKDVLVASVAALVETPSWEPIASKAGVEEDPLLELDREEHHPSANIQYPEMINEAFTRNNAHSKHLDQYALRVVFAKRFYNDSARVAHSGALGSVAKSAKNDLVRVNPKDLESVAVREDNTVTLHNDMGEVTLRVVPDKGVMRGVLVADANSDHPLRALVNSGDVVTDVRVEAAK